MTRIGVLGAGSFGTALAISAARADNEVTLWARRPELAATLRQANANEEYLPGCAFPPGLAVSSDLAELTSSDAVLMVVPSHGFRGVLRDFLRQLPAGHRTTVISAAKGIETETLARMSQVCFEEAVAADLEIRFAALAGPSFASELAAGMPTVAVVASEDGTLADELREILATRSFRLYSTTDVVGVELGGTTKNVIAIAAGVVSGLGLGYNTQAALITRGLHEITRLAMACGARARTMAGLAGLGDLVLTCTGGLSRNRRLGLDLAAGKTLEEISGSTSMVAEGVRNSMAVARLAERMRVDMPITEEMVEVLYRGKTPQKVVEDLMSREPKSELEL